MNGLQYWLLALVSMRFRVANCSMAPTLLPGDRLLVDRLAYHHRAPRRGDVAVVRHPHRPDLELVKRVIGLPGEHVVLRAGKLLVAGQVLDEPYMQAPQAANADREWHLASGEFLVLGDNRTASTDSRHFGPVGRALMRGPAWYRYAPPDRRGRLDRHGY